jgi:hypothetical protein
VHAVRINVAFVMYEILKINVPLLPTVLTVVVEILVLTPSLADLKSAMGALKSVVLRGAGQKRMDVRHLV